VTAHENHAVYAFECNAFDYLTKPVNRERLNKSIMKIESKYGAKTAKSEINIQCFDVFKVFVNNEEVKFRTSKSQELIAYLMHRGGKSISRTEITENLWGEFDGDKAIVNFNTTLSYIRKAFSSYYMEFPIIFDRGSYIVDMTHVNCDYFKFAEFRNENEVKDDETAMQYESIINLYNGDYLAANDYPWAGNRKIILKGKYIRLIKAVSKYYYGVKNYEKVIEYMVRGFIITPLDTEIINCLISTLISTGNITLAINYYKIYSESLQNELKMEPDTSLKQLLGIF
jgi:Response regulator containing CheY-like receiver and SARP domains